ncbi:MAG: hypothetical protein OXH50_12730 [Gemmatimonadetes bacterium]|nr:hypothetical protein [Gemmatimonadota bacterium]
MRKRFSAAAAAAALLCMSTFAFAHVPADFIGLFWQWPSNQVPVLDGDLSEWAVVPDDYSWTTDEANAKFAPGEGMFIPNDTPDLASIDFKVTFSYVDGQPRLYYGYERFDDVWTSDDDIEIYIDGDHTGGTYWSDIGYRYEGTPGSFQEVTMSVEFYETVWDDFNWQDPDGSIQHVMREGEIIGHGINLWEFDGTEETYRTDGCECGATWSDNTAGETWVDASFFPDYLLDEVQTDLIGTAVEEDSWGNIKASMRR